MSTTGWWLLAGRLFAVACLGAGVWLLAWTWEGLNYLAMNRSLGYPAWVSRSEVAVWHGIPGFQAGLLVGLFPLFVKRGVGSLFRGMSTIVWSLNLANFSVFFAIAAAPP
jgi:hypothetical protein